MITKNELRVGLWVSVPMCAAHWQIKTIGESSCTIDDYNNDLSVEENDIPFDEIIGIPVTPELLLAFGFKKEDYDYDNEEYPLGTTGEYSLRETTVAFWKDRRKPTLSIIDAFPNIDFECEFLHQIQNTYFFSMGRELIDINPYVEKLKPAKAKGKRLLKIV